VAGDAAVGAPEVLRPDLLHPRGDAAGLLGAVLLRDEALELALAKILKLKANRLLPSLSKRYPRLILRKKLANKKSLR
jgi:hypothetical protein